MSILEYVGYDYAQTILELSHRMTYDQIARAVGYKNKSSVHMILDGSVPSHDRGEALWVLYQETFGRKPPHTAVQAKGRSKQTTPTV